MAQGRVLALRASYLRVYVFYSPGPWSQVNRDLDLAHIEEQVTAGQYQARFANTAICSYESANHNQALQEFMQDWEQLKMGIYGQIWFYGAGAHVYALHVARLARTQGVEVVNFASKNSTLDRVLQAWFKSKRDTVRSDPWS